MVLWQIVLILLVSIGVGAFAGALLSYLISRFVKKRETISLSDFIPQFALKRVVTSLSDSVPRFATKQETASLSDFLSQFTPTPEVPEASITPADAGDNELYQGRVELEVTAPTDFVQMWKLRAYLSMVPSIRVASVGGSASGGTTIVVILDKPLPLVSILNEIPLAKGVVKKEKNIRVALELPQPA